MNEEWGNRKAEARARRFRMIALALKHQEMSIEYTTKGASFRFDYQLMKEKHAYYCGLPDESFIAILPEILHISCAICYFKGLGPDETVGDKGVIHELVHLLHIPNEAVISVSAVRELFERHCKLA